jgi:hypothetical protein
MGHQVVDENVEFVNNADADGSCGPSQGHNSKACPSPDLYSPTALAAFSRNNDPSRM